MRISDERKKECYKEGWWFAENDWHDFIPYDEQTNSDYEHSVENEEWVQGYYDFWSAKNFEL